MNKYFIGLLTASMLFGSAIAVSAADYEFFVRNRPFTGASISGKSVEASLSDLLQALGYSWSVQDHKIYVYNQKGKGPAFVDSGVYTIEFDGHSTSVTLNARGGRSMVDVASLAKALDLKYQVSESLNTIDLLIPMSKSKADDMVAAYKKAAGYGKADANKDGSKDGKDTKKASKYKLNAEGKMEIKFACPYPGSVEPSGSSDSKMVVNSVDWFINDMGSFSVPAEVRLNSVSLTNSGEPVENVTLKIDISYEDGFSAYSWTKTYPVFNAAQSETFIPDPQVWNNYNRTPISLTVTVTHDPPKEKEEVKKKKKNKITADVDDMRIGQSDSRVGGVYRAAEEEAEEEEEGGEAEGAEEPAAQESK